MSRYGITQYGQGYYGETSASGLYDASPVVALSFPRPYLDRREPGHPFYLPSDYSPSPVDPEIAYPEAQAPAEDYPDMWSGAYFAQYTPVGDESGAHFNYILLTWSIPDGEWTDLSIVRRRTGPPDTVDDGTTVLTLPKATNRNEYVDTLTQGETAYYGVFVRKTNGAWVMCGYTEAVNCRTHGGLNEFLGAIPRVYTSSSGGMLDAVDRSRGQLSRFLQGLSFEYDYWKTQADRLSHDSGRMPVASVQAWAKQLGMTDLDLYTIGDRNLRRWLASASSYSEAKGTKNGIEALASALSGWPVTASMSPNLMLTTDDSSAENSTGNWAVSGGVLGRAAIGGPVTSPVPSPITNSLGGAPHLQGYVFTFAPSGATATMSLGVSDPINYGIPVDPGVSYKFNICWKSTVTTTGSLKADLSWYDIRGNLISSSSGTNQAASSSWQQTGTTTTSSMPSNAAYLGITLSFSGISGSPVYHLDMGQVCPSSTDISGKFYEARAIDLNVEAVRTNLCLNPSFETNASNWAGSGLSQGPANSGYVGGSVSLVSLRLTNTQTAAGVSTTTATGSFSEGDPVTASIHVKPSTVATKSGTYSLSATTNTITSSAHGLTSGDRVYLTFTSGTAPGGEYVVSSSTTNTFTVTSNEGSSSGNVTIEVLSAKVRMKVDWLSSAGSVLETHSELVDTPLGQWNRIGLTLLQAPANTSKVQVTVAGTGTSSTITGTGSTMDIDGCLIEKRDTTLSYFDGSTYEDTGNSTWTGTAHASESRLYPMRLTRQSSLGRIMNEYSPEPANVRVVLS